MSIPKRKRTAAVFVRPAERHILRPTQVKLGARVRILLVEDDSVQAKSLQHEIVSQGHVCEVRTSLADLDVAALATKCDFAVVDLFLPGSEPEETIAAVSKWPVRAIMLSAGANYDLSRKAAQMGLFLYPKPPNSFNMETICGCIVGMAERDKAQNKRVNEAVAALEKATEQRPGA